MTPPTEAALGKKGILRIGPTNRSTPGIHPLSFSGVWFLFILLALPVAAQPVKPSASYFRSYVNDIVNEPLVTVSVTGAVDVACFTIEETLPAPATPISISGDGVYLPAQNVIRWGPFLNITATNVSYRLTGLPAVYPVNGGAWMDGQWYFSPGVTLVPILPPNPIGAIPTIPPQVPPPVFSPPSGGTVPVAGVAITDSLQGAAIYYSLDGSPPNQNSLPYLGAIHPSSSSAIIRAVAYSPGYTASAITVADYGPPAGPVNAQVMRSVNTSSPSMPVVTFSVTPGPNAKCVAVTETLPAGLAATAVTDGGNYLPANNVIEWGPFLGTAPQTLSYNPVGQPGTYPVQASWSVDGTNGGETSATTIVIAPGSGYTIPVPPPQVPPPVFSPPSGGTVPVAGVTITDPLQGATIYYTLGGLYPTNPIPYSTAIHLASSGAIIRAIAYAPGYSASAITVADYGPPAGPVNAQVMRNVNTSSPSMPVVTFSVTPGPNAKCVAVTETLPAGLAATAVTDGGTYLPVNHVIEWGPFLGTAPQTLSYNPVGQPGTYPVQASWSVDGTNGGETSATAIVIAPGPGNTIPIPLPQVPAPLLTPNFGSSLPVTVSMYCSDPLAKIYYTTDGSLPTDGMPGSTLYMMTPETFTTKTSLRAVAFRAGYLPSVAVVGEYVPIVTSDTVALAPALTENGGLQPGFSLTATPDSSVKCYSIVETIPAGLTASDVSGDGIWDPVAGVIRWGPYLDHLQRIFSFNVEGMPGAYALSSQASFDGYSSTATTYVQVSEIPDTTPPSLAITSISDGASVASASLLISGTATDSGTGNNGISSVTVNGIPANNDTASGAGTANWSATVQLHSGPNPIEVIASDDLNNSTQADITVMYNPPSPAFAGAAMAGNGEFQLTLSGVTVGETVELDESTDLKTWTEVETVTAVGTTVTFTVSINPSASGEFYRVKVQ